MNQHDTARHRARPARPARRRATTVATSALVVALAGGAVVSTWSAFQQTTANEGNTFSTATVTLTDNDTVETVPYAMFDASRASNLLPGQTVTRCIEVTYTSTATAGTPTVSMWATGDASNTLADDLEVTITRGSVTGAAPFPGDTCGTFTPDGPALVTAQPFNTFLTTYTALAPLGTGTWVNDEAGDRHAFKVDITVQDDASAGESIGSIAFTWRSDTGTA